MNPTKYLKGLEQKNQELSMKNDEYSKLIVDRASAERDYKIAFAKKVLELKSEGQSVTLIEKIASGDKHVAELKFNMDVADALTKACREHMRNLHAMIDSYRSTLVWLRAELESR